MITRKEHQRRGVERRGDKEEEGGEYCNRE